MELSRHIRIAKQQPAPVMAALLNHLFSPQVLQTTPSHALCCLSEPSHPLSCTRSIWSICCFACYIAPGGWRDGAEHMPCRSPFSKKA